MSDWTIDSIKQVIKQDILLDRLELNQLGLGMDDLKDDIPLLEESGLNLDSVNALDIVSAVQQIFGFEIPSVGGGFFDTHVRTIDTLASYILGRLEAVAA